MERHADSRFQVQLKEEGGSIQQLDGNKCDMTYAALEKRGILHYSALK